MPVTQEVAGSSPVRTALDLAMTLKSKELQTQKASELSFELSESVIYEEKVKY